MIPGGGRVAGGGGVQSHGLATVTGRWVARTSQRVRTPSVRCLHERTRLLQGSPGGGDEIPATPRARSFAGALREGTATPAAGGVGPGIRKREQSIRRSFRDRIVSMGPAEVTTTTPPAGCSRKDRWRLEGGNREDVRRYGPPTELSPRLETCGVAWSADPTLEFSGLGSDGSRCLVLDKERVGGGGVGGVRAMRL